MMKRDHGPTKLLHALTWGAFDHVSHAPEVKACNYCIYTHTDILSCIEMHACIYIYHR